MKLNILGEREKKLLGRKEIDLEAEFDNTTPTGSAMLAEVGALIKAKDISLVRVKKVDQNYGAHSAKVLVFVYNSEKELKACEKIPRKTRKELKKKLIEEMKKKALEKKTEKAKTGEIKTEKVAENA